MQAPNLRNRKLNRPDHSYFRIKRRKQLQAHLFDSGFNKKAVTAQPCQAGLLQLIIITAEKPFSNQTV